MFWWFNIEAALQTTGLRESDGKEVVEKQLKNASKRKGGGKIEKDKDMTNTTNVN